MGVRHFWRGTPHIHEQGLLMWGQPDSNFDAAPSAPDGQLPLGPDRPIVSRADRVFEANLRKVSGVKPRILRWAICDAESEKIKQTGPYLTLSSETSTCQSQLSTPQLFFFGVFCPCPRLYCPKANVRIIVGPALGPAFVGLPQRGWLPGPHQGDRFKGLAARRFFFPDGCGSKIGTQNRTLVNGTMD